MIIIIIIIIKSRTICCGRQWPSVDISHSLLWPAVSGHRWTRFTIHWVRQWMPIDRQSIDADNVYRYIYTFHNLLSQTIHIDISPPLIYYYCRSNRLFIIVGSIVQSVVGWGWMGDTSKGPTTACEPFPPSVIISSTSLITFSFWIISADHSEWARQSIKNCIYLQDPTQWLRVLVNWSLRTDRWTII